MNILNVNHLIDPKSGGGTAERTVQLSKHFAAAGASVEVLTFNIGLTEARRGALKGVRVTAIPCINRRYFIPSFPWREIERAVSRADVVHLSGHWTLLNVLVRHACARQGKLYVFCPSGALRLIGRSKWLKRIYNKLCGAVIIRGAAACISITAEEKKDFDTYAVPAEKIEVIPNGIDPTDYVNDHSLLTESSVRERLGVGVDSFLLFLGRLSWIKGPDLLLEAFCKFAANYPDLHLVLAGPDDGMLEQLKKIAGSSQFNNRIHFPGYLSGIEKQVALRSAILLTIPSRSEAMSIVILEAGAVGTPVLFTTTCGLADFADEGAGIQVLPSTEEIARGIQKFLTDSKSDYAGRVRLQHLVQSNYLWSYQAQRYLTLYGQLLSGPKH